jgi:hypothetical protein
MTAARYYHGVSPSTYKHLNRKDVLHNSHILVQRLLSIKPEKVDYIRVRAILRDIQMQRERLHKGN